MGLTWWVGIGAGIGVIGVHGALRVLTHALSLRAFSSHAFLLLELGGLGVRMALVLGAVVGIVLYTPVHAPAFAGTVSALLVVSVGVEAYVMARRTECGTLDG